MTDDSGDPTGTTGYNAFGSVRATSGDTSALGFTGQQSAPETGLIYLRARYLSPAIGQFISADAVQPNAPGTQGYNLYAYTANNPMNWIDPSGHSAMTQWQADTAQVLANPLSMIIGRLSDSTLIGLPLTIMSIAFPVLICAFRRCIDRAIRLADIIEKYGTSCRDRRRKLDLGRVREGRDAVPADHVGRVGTQFQRFHAYPDYRHAADQGNVRPRCRWISVCARRRSRGRRGRRL